MMRTLLLLLMTLLAVTWTTDAVSTIKFDGCYHGLDESLGVSYDLPLSNLNSDCAYFCASAGYMLAATKGPTCHCTNRYPAEDSLLQSPYNATKYGDQRCTTVCPGAVHTTDDGGCEGDVCCGHVWGNAYSVYAVGGIDVLGVVLKRIRRAITSRTHAMPWITEAYTSSCTDDFERFPIKHDLYVTLELEPVKSLRGIGNKDECRRRCLDERMTCRAFTFSKKLGRCDIFEESSAQADIKPSDHEVHIYDRNCAEKVFIMPNQTFRLEMLNQDFLMASNPGIDKRPLDNQDFELDLTYSNSWDQLSRSFDVSVGEQASFSTDSGFDIAASESKSESTTDSTETTQETSDTSESSKSANFGVSVTASVSADFFFGSASASVGASSNFGFSSSSSNTRTSSHSSASSTTRSLTRDLSRSQSYNAGHARVFSSNKQTTMQYSLTVPAMHKRMLVFSKEQRKTIVKMRSVFQLNGYLKFDINGRTKVVHVSRVLKGDDRLFSTFTAAVFERPLITAKTTVFDRQGKRVDTQLLVPEEEE